MRFSLGNFIWRIVDLIIAAIFIYAGVLKALDPVQLAHDIDHYKILPWTVGVGLAFYLPWLEIFCGLALIFRLFYRGALSILTALVVVFLVSTIAAKVRGLDITCGCFGHASQNWSFPRTWRWIWEFSLLWLCFVTAASRERVQTLRQCLRHEA